MSSILLLVVFAALLAGSQAHTVRGRVLVPEDARDAPASFFVATSVLLDNGAYSVCLLSRFCGASCSHPIPIPRRR